MKFKVLAGVGEGVGKASGIVIFGGGLKAVVVTLLRVRGEGNVAEGFRLGFLKVAAPPDVSFLRRLRTGLGAASLALGRISSIMEDI